MQDPAPIFFAVEQDDKVVPGDFPRLDQSQDFKQLVQGSEAAREGDDRPGPRDQPELSHEKIMEGESQLGGDEPVRLLLVGQGDVHAHGLAPGPRRAAVRRLHDARPRARADDEILAFGAQRDGPAGQVVSQAFGVDVIAVERRCGVRLVDPGGAEEEDGGVDLQLLESGQGLQVFAQDPDRPGFGRSQEFRVFIGDGGGRGIVHGTSHQLRHSSPTAF